MVESRLIHPIYQQFLTDSFCIISWVKLWDDTYTLRDHWIQHHTQLEGGRKLVTLICIPSLSLLGCLDKRKEDCKRFSTFSFDLSLGPFIYWELRYFSLGSPLKHSSRSSGALFSSSITHMGQYSHPHRMIRHSYIRRFCASRHYTFFLRVLEKGKLSNLTLFRLVVGRENQEMPKLQDAKLNALETD